MVFRPEMLAVDFTAAMRLPDHMDDATRDLIVQLCTRAGMVMEDASVLALGSARLGDDIDLLKRVDKLRASAQVITACIDAAASLAK